MHVDGLVGEERLNLLARALCLQTVYTAVASGEWREDDLNAVRKLHREAQWFFDYCYVENSEGAHNSELSMNCLNTSEAKIDEAMNLLNKKTT